MQVATVTLESISPYSQSKYIDKELVPAIGKESHDDYEKRTWKNRVHLDTNGVPFMPPMSLKKSLEGAAPYLGKIPGLGQATYSKRVKSGILVTDPIPLTTNGRDMKSEDWTGEWLFLDAQGKNGDKRVKRCMPRVDPWQAVATIYVVDEIINKDVLTKLIENAGMFVGVGRFRPANGGFYGRFKLTKLTLKDAG